MPSCGTAGCPCRAHSGPGFGGYCCQACAATGGLEHGPSCDGHAMPRVPPAAAVGPAAQVAGDAGPWDSQGNLPAGGEGPSTPPSAPRAWEECGGFRKRAPDERLKAENARIQAKDEQVVRQLQAQKRAEAREILSQSHGGVLGSAGGSPGSLQEARLALVDKLAREAAPAARRRRRKQEEQRQRELEQGKRAAVEQRRLQEWAERQHQQAAKDRALNQAKRCHWQAWDERSSQEEAACAGEPGTPEAPPAGDSCPADLGSQLVGRWLYGARPNEYSIGRAADGRLRFDGPNPSGGRLSGILEPKGAGFEAELSSGDGAPFGTMRFCLQPSDTGAAELVSSFRKADRADWGKANVARKAMRTGSSSPASGRARPAPW